MKKIAYEMVFMICAAILMIFMINILPPNYYMAFSFLPVLIAFYIGQLIERKFGKTKKMD